MREIVVKDNKVFYKDELEPEGKFSKPEMSLRHIQLDKQGLNNYLQEMSSEDIKFFSMSAKIFGKEGTYDILIEEAQLPSKVGVNIERVNVKKKLRESAGIKAELHLEKGVFLALTGKKMQPGDFFFEKVLLDRQIIEMPINVERVIDGVDGLYQIVIDKDGDFGYNVWVKGADVKRPCFFSSYNKNSTNKSHFRHCNLLPNTI